MKRTRVWAGTWIWQQVRRLLVVSYFAAVGMAGYQIGGTAVTNWRASAPVVWTPESWLKAYDQVQNELDAIERQLRLLERNAVWPQPRQPRRLQQQDEAI